MISLSVNHVTFTIFIIAVHFINDLCECKLCFNRSLYWTCTFVWRPAILEVSLVNKFIGAYAIVALFIRSKYAETICRKTANVNTSPWTLHTRNMYKFAADQGDRHASSILEAATEYACVRSLIPFRRRRIHSHTLTTSTYSLRRVSTLSSQYQSVKCDIAHAAPIGVTHSETHHGGHVTPGLEVRAHYTPM